MTRQFGKFVGLPSLCTSCFD